MEEKCILQVCNKSWNIFTQNSIVVSVLHSVVTFLVECSSCIKMVRLFIQIVVDVFKFLTLRWYLVSGCFQILDTEMILSVPFSNSQDWIIRSTHKTTLRLRCSNKCLEASSDQDSQLQTDTLHYFILSRLRWGHLYIHPSREDETTAFQKNIWIPSCLNRD